MFSLLIGLNWVSCDLKEASDRACWVGIIRTSGSAFWMGYALAEQACWKNALPFCACSLASSSFDHGNISKSRCLVMILTRVVLFYNSCWMTSHPSKSLPDSTCLFLHLFHQVRRAVIAPSCQPFCTPSFLLGPHCGLNVCVPLQIQMLKPLLHAGGIWSLWRCSDHGGNSQHAWD